jgi:hypothetical protein
MSRFYIKDRDLHDIAYLCQQIALSSFDSRTPLLVHDVDGRVC